MTTSDTATPAPARKRWRWVAVLAFTALLWAVLELSGLRRHISLLALHDGLLQHPGWGLLAFTVAFALANLIHVPGGFFLAAAVLALGPVRGALTTYVAACIACLLTFIVVRALGADALRELDGRLARRLFARLDAHPLRSVVLLRLAFQTMPTLNYALALSGVGWRPYLLGTALGLVLPIAVMTALFDTLAAWAGWHVG